MSKFYSLFSSSKGNCSFIENESGGILIDASPSYKSIVSALNDNGIDKERIKAVLLTHEHSDHVSALKVLTKNLKVPVFASSKVIQFLEEKELISHESEVHEVSDGNLYDIAEFGITPFKTPHDSIESFGFTIQSGSSILGYATDLGVMTPEILSKLKSCKTVYIESNYDENMLVCGTYNRLLKMRIMGEKGHLSNYDCASAVSKLLSSGANRFILAHLSEENNTPQLAKCETEERLQTYGAKFGSDYTLDVSSRFGLSKPIIF